MRLLTYPAVVNRPLFAGGRSPVNYMRVYQDNVAEQPVGTRLTDSQLAKRILAMFHTATKSALVLCRIRDCCGMSDEGERVRIIVTRLIPMRSLQGNEL